MLLYRITLLSVAEWEWEFDAEELICGKSMTMWHCECIAARVHWQMLLSEKDDFVGMWFGIVLIYNCSSLEIFAAHWASSYSIMSELLSAHWAIPLLLFNVQLLIGNDSVFIL